MGFSVRYAAPAVPVTFLSRPNRYLALVRLRRSGRSAWAHVPNPGRMEELLLPGTTTGYAIPSTNPRRKTRFDLVAVRAGRALVSIDARLGNRVVAEALRRGAIRGLGRGGWRGEFPWRGSRIDFGRRPPGGASVSALLEVKSSNLRVGRTAFFPDAPTRRGAHHVDLLAGAAGEGIHATLVFVVQRHDVDELRPNRALDPRFADSLAAAEGAGVRLLAFTIAVRPASARWGRQVPVVTASSGQPI